VIRYDDIKDYLPADTSGSVLITTQSDTLQFGTRKLNPNILVKELDARRGAQMLLYYLEADQARKQDFNDDIELAEKISFWLGGLPLALALIAGYLVKSRCSLQDFASEFTSRSPISTILENKVFTPERGFAFVFDRALNPEFLPSDARAVLDGLAFMNPDKIQEAMIFNTECPEVSALLGISDDTNIFDM
jgi:hypothetical protein